MSICNVGMAEARALFGMMTEDLESRDNVLIFTQYFILEIKDKEQIRSAVLQLKFVVH